ncbi:hypothetical protein BDW22DRAFT_816917 [Trametopsis cervina]|nr:hypothetical protein BDW22DRAFT_816917 [Trametopsis cervina]
MMKLRDLSSNEGPSEHGRTWSSIRFVGNMGQALRAPGEEDDEEGWDDELPQDQEQQEDSNGTDSPSAIDRRVQDREAGGGDTPSHFQSTAGVVGQDA